MSSVGVKELKDRLTHYLRQTKRGEEVVVTERGKAIAVIQRIQAVQRVGSLEARLAKLAEEGVVTLPTAKPLGRVRKIKVPGRPLSKAILAARR